MKFGIQNNLIGNINDDKLYDYYLSLDSSKESIIKQAETIRKIAEQEDAVIVGRASDYILKDNKNLIRIFLYANDEYRIKNIMNNYKDNRKSTIKYIKDSDKARSSYYEVISNNIWGAKENYDIIINTEIGNNKVADTLENFVKNITKK